MLIVGQQSGKWYESAIATRGDYISYATIGKDFSFMIVQEKKNYDYANRVAKATKSITIRTDAKLEFKENDKIVYEEKDYFISDVTIEKSKMTTLLQNKLIVMVG